MSKNCDDRIKCPYENDYGTFDGSDDEWTEQLLENCLLNAHDKEPSVRKQGLEALVVILRDRPSSDFVTRHKKILLELCSRVSNKPNDEAYFLVYLIGLVAVQTEETDDSSLTRRTLAQLRPILMDVSKCIYLRIACAVVLGIATRVFVSDQHEIFQYAEACKFAWTIKNPTKNYKFGRLVYVLAVTSLSSWCAILRNFRKNNLDEMLKDQSSVAKLLNIKELDVKLAAAEALGFLYELTDRKPGTFKNKSVLLKRLKQESVKRSNRSLKSSIRNIYDFIDDESDAPKKDVKIGSETLGIDSFAQKIFYDLSTDLLGRGIDQHLRSNHLFRTTFNIRPIYQAVVEIAMWSRAIDANNSQRLYTRAAIDKYRNIKLRNARIRKTQRNNRIYDSDDEEEENNCL